MSKNTKQVSPAPKTTKQQLRQLNEIINEEPEVPMLKVMETYRKGVEYYNSYGLNESSANVQKKTTGKNSNTGGGSFWDLN